MTTTTNQQTNTPAAVTPIRHTFDYDGITLLPSRFQEQVARAREVYYGLPNDDVLHGFRQQAGLPAPGNGMRGWCARTSAVIFGQLLSGMARLSRATGDEALRQKAIALFEGWRETIGPDGDARMWPYAWEKLVCGLVDLQQYAGHDAALPVLEETTAWAARTFDRTRRPADEYDFWGAGPVESHEWYTLPENLYRAYLLSGNPLFKEFADVWRYEAYWDQFAETSELTDIRVRPRLQPRQHLQQRRHGLRGQRRSPLPPHLRQRLRLPAADTVLRHRRLRPRRAADGARRATWAAPSTSTPGTPRSPAARGRPSSSPAT